METLPQGSDVCIPKAKVQSHLDPWEVSWKNGSLLYTKLYAHWYKNKCICFTSEKELNSSE